MRYCWDWTLAGHVFYILAVSLDIYSCMYDRYGEWSICILDDKQHWWYPWIFWRYIELSSDLCKEVWWITSSSSHFLIIGKINCVSWTGWMSISWCIHQINATINVSRYFVLKECRSNGMIDLLHVFLISVNAQDTKIFGRSISENIYVFSMSLR